jgi:5'-deoxynucleotidase YfbR-like HD superfamily hydrolase
VTSSSTEVVFPLLRKLLFAKRFSRDLLIMPESVLQHIGFCTSYALFVSERLNRSGIQVNQGLLLRRAVLHDFEEAETGDVPRPTKYHSDKSRAALETFATESARSIFHAPYNDFFSTWENCKDDSIEGVILRLTDLAAVVFTVDLEFNRLGNKTANRIRKEVSIYLHEAQFPSFLDPEIEALQATISGDL